MYNGKKTSNNKSSLALKVEAISIMDRMTFKIDILIDKFKQNAIKED